MRRHLGELAELPDLDDKVGPGVDHAGETDHQHPHHQHDAGQIMNVEPAHHPRPVAPVGAELQLPHRRRVDHDAGNDRHAKQDAHEAEKQLAGQIGEHVGVQLEHDVGEAAGDIRRVEIGSGVRVEADKTVLRRTGVERLADAHHHGVGIVVIPDQEVRDMAGVFRQTVFHHLVEIGVGRAGGPLRPLDLLMQEVVDLEMEDQRQAGDTEHQHEGGADDARPFVHPAPLPQRRRS